MSSASRSRSGGGSRRSAPNCSIREQQANRLKDEFLATVSHELRTPLNAVLGWARVLRSADIDPELQARALESIERNAQSQARLIEDILEVSRIVTGKLRLKVRTLDLAQVIDAARRRGAPGGRSEGHHAQNRYRRAAVARALATPDRLQQIVWNLLSNAVKFTPRGGTVTATLARANGSDEIIVTDTGKGIDPSFLPHVFAAVPPGRRLARRAITAGSAWGLPSCGSSPSCTAARCGPRARAWIAARGSSSPCPRSRRRPAAAPDSGRHRAAASDGPPDLAGVRVMVVDDDRDARELLTATLGYYGADVTAAESAAEALRLLPEVRPDVLLSDIGMSGRGWLLVHPPRALAAGRPRRSHPGCRHHRLRDGRRSRAGDELRFPAARAQAVRSRRPRAHGATPDRQPCEREVGTARAGGGGLRPTALGAQRSTTTGRSLLAIATLPALSAA